MASELLYLSRADVEAAALPMHEIIGALEEMFKAKGRGEVEMPPKPGIHPRPDAFIHAMPAYLPHAGAAGMKWVSGFPENMRRGLPYIHGLIILNDPETGVPTAVMDCTWITAMRTGAATAIAAKHLARPESSSCGIVACGVQGRSNLEALACVFELRRVAAFDVNRDTARRFADEMGERLGLDIDVAQRPEDAVRGRDLVVTSGPILKRPRPVIDAGWLAEGAFAAPVDFDSYFTGAALAQADILVTDDIAQLDYYRREGYFASTPRIDTDLGHLATGARPGRTRPEQRAICINLGLALEDMATAIRILGRARERGLGRRLPL
jgi:ornithine cyclodeaminase/alanine dehydrogenase-like protein (mu-crystallin family)